MKNRLSVLWTSYTDMTLKQQLTLVIGGILTIALIIIGIFMAMPKTDSRDQVLLSDKNVTVKDVNINAVTQPGSVEVPAEIKNYEAPTNTQIEPIVEGNTGTTETSNAGTAVTPDGYRYEVDDIPVTEQPVYEAPVYTEPKVEQVSGDWNIPMASGGEPNAWEDGTGKGESQ
jgi:hypothetical protein